MSSGTAATVSPAGDAASNAQPGFHKSSPRNLLESLLIAVILALFVRTFVTQAFQIPTASMEPNLLIGDHLLVNKVAASPSWGPWEDRLLGKRELRRGDVVIFKYPRDPNRDFIKRVIGLPGERIEVDDATVLVDGVPLEEPYAHFSEAHFAADDPEHGLGVGRKPWGPETVPAGHVFVLGDNRDNSQDSRYWGFLPVDQLRGRALLVYWSYAATREEYRSASALAWIQNAARAVSRTRWSRFFHLIR